MTNKKIINNKKLNNFQNLMKIGRFDQASVIIEELILNNPGSSELIYQSSIAYVKSGNYQKAYEKMELILQEYSFEGEFLSNFGIVCTHLNLLNKAEYLLKFAIKANPNNVTYILNLAGVYNKLEKYNQAIDCIKSAINLNPINKQIYISLGVSLVKINEKSAAKDAFLISLSLDPECNESLFNLAAIEHLEENYEFALNLYNKLLDKQNENNSNILIEPIKFSLSLLYLNFGKLKDGWDFFEFGFSPNVSPEYRRNPTRLFKKPMWDGITIKDSRILIWREQGVGDEIMFMTCLPDLIQTGINIIIECDPRLISILSRSFPNCIVRGQSFDSSHNRMAMYQDYDFHLPVGSLMRLFRSKIDDFHKSEKYIQVDAVLASKYNDLLQKKHVKTKMVGICWRSGHLNFERNIEYTKLKEWRAILTVPDIQFINLQYDECEEELVEAETLFGIKIMRWSELDLKNDFESTMALMSNLDLVVTVGTAVSPMAASIGIPVYLMTRKGWPNLGTDYYPWFKNVDCFFPKLNGDLGSCIQDVAKALNQFKST